MTEAEMLMLPEKNIRSPRFGGPIIGCIQDHISGNYMLTRQGTEFTKEQAVQFMADIGIEKRINKDLRFCQRT